MRESAVWEGIYKEWRRGESKFRSLWSISGKEKYIGRGHVIVFERGNCGVINRLYFQPPVI